MRQIRIGRRAAIGLAVVACAVAIGTPVALAHRTTPAATTTTGNVVNGYEVFNDYFCVACHTLKAGGPAAYGQLGVNLNKTHVAATSAVSDVTNGLPAALPLYPTEMVPFGKVLTKSQINDVAAFISTYSGGYKTCAPCADVTPTGFPGSALGTTATTS